MLTSTISLLEGLLNNPDYVLLHDDLKRVLVAVKIATVREEIFEQKSDLSWLNWELANPPSPDDPIDRNSFIELHNTATSKLNTLTMRLNNLKQELK